MLSELNKAKLYNAATTGDINLFYYLDECQESIIEPITDDNTTALHIAAESGNLPIVNLLLLKKSNVNAINTFGGTPLHMAVQSSSPEIIRLLLVHQADANIQNDYKETALHMAVENQDEIVLKELLNNPTIQLDIKNHIGNTALHIAAKKGGENILKDLLIASKEKNNILQLINLKNHSGKTPLDLATQHNHSEAITLITEYEQEAIVNELATTHHDRSFFIKKDDSHSRSSSPDLDLHPNSSFVKKVYFPHKDTSSYSRSSSPIKDFSVSSSPSGSFVKKESCHDRACFLKKEESFSRPNTPEKCSTIRSFTNKGTEMLPDIPNIHGSPTNKQNSPPHRLRKM